jgi:glycerol-3-phosphate dehydrogenase (NAD(P)+)
MRIAVLGAGAWGTALAIHAARRHPVRLFSRSPAHAAAMAEARGNPRYLPGIRFPDALDATDSLDELMHWLTGGDANIPRLLVIGTTVAGLRPTLAALRERAQPLVDAIPVVWLCKGLESGTGLLPHQVAAQSWPRLRGAALSGPSFAQEVAAGLPVALTVATADDDLADAVVQGLHHGAARIYRADDIVGVEVGGALKNVMAIAAGICDGLALGHNARAALITRGLAEIARYGTAQGAQAGTFMGLTGLGDLVLTCTGDLSRNRRVGLALAAGRPLAAALAELGHVAEGVPCTEEVVRQAALAGIDVPIAAAVQAVIAGRLSAREAVLSLLAREPKREH